MKLLVEKMTGKVFISAGSRGERENLIIDEVKRVLEEQPLSLEVYVAKMKQGLNDIMRIVDELRSADYYLFIDFKRNGDWPISLFTHQELALAQEFGFKETIVFQEDGLESEGFLKYVQGNPTKFKDGPDLCTKLRQLVKDAKWNSRYSRNLVFEGTLPDPAGEVQYRDQGGAFVRERIVHGVIANHRKDAALNVVCILEKITRGGTTIPLLDSTHLKWAYKFMGFETTILPESRAKIDLYAYRPGSPGVFLHSEWDQHPRPPVVTDYGDYVFHYKVVSVNFPPLDFLVEVRVPAPSGSVVAGIPQKDVPGVTRSGM